MTVVWNWRGTIRNHAVYARPDGASVRQQVPAILMEQSGEKSV